VSFRDPNECPPGDPFQVGILFFAGEEPQGHTSPGSVACRLCGCGDSCQFTGVLFVTFNSIDFRRKLGEKLGVDCDHSCRFSKRVFGKKIVHPGVAARIATVSAKWVNNRA
jgi:hypothetical protein